MIEHERRFIVPGTLDLEEYTPQIIMQGYFLNRDGYAIRVRRVSTPEVDGFEYGSITAKGPRAPNGDREEIECMIEDPRFAGNLLLRCTRKVLKRRYGLSDTWTVDVFDWENEGLIVAEFEAETPEAVRSVELPEYVGREITGETQFNNEWLAYRPWTTWTEASRSLWLE